MLLEDARLSCPKPIKGLAFGGARVSSKHCRHAHFLVEQRMRVNAELNHFEASSWIRALVSVAKLRFELFSQVDQLHCR